MTFTFKHWFAAWTGLGDFYMTLTLYKGSLPCCKGYW